MQNDKATQYLVAIVAVASFILGAISLLNYVVDPLWFFGGNKLQGRNFPFDERTAQGRALCGE